MGEEVHEQGTLLPGPFQNMQTHDPPAHTLNHLNRPKDSML
jgi:hypothetical protein